MSWRLARRVGTIAAVVGAVASTAAAQTRHDDATAVQFRPVFRPTPPSIGFRAYGFYDGTLVAAADTFAAVLGTSRISGGGAGLEIIRIHRGLFLRGAASTAEASGTRVLVFNEQAISLGIPLVVEMRHLEIGGGWRFESTRSLRPSRVVGYAGASLVRLNYRETSDFADTGEDTDAVFTGFAIFGGVDVSVWKWIMAGAEVNLRTVPNAIGTAGASKEFIESDLGGATFRVMVGLRK